MHLSFKIIAGGAILFGSFFGTLLMMDYYTPMCPRGTVFEFHAPFAKFGNGAAYSMAAPALDSIADSGTTPTKSRYVVCEDTHALGPAHTAHAEIIAKGSGRYSHWAGIGFVFSASDDSDPNTNHHIYRAVAP